ncbi:MAG: MFS transporter [Candidatus Calescibacterium sp.]|jgi:MFS family permease|nr:MFS transporter [Candidatus Calescibacterium sp.]
MKIILLLGLVSLFADITYESARSISGPFLASLGAGAFLISFVGGLGEFIGYGLRIFAGYISDKLKNYWGLTILGYFLGLFSLPLLAFAQNWQFAITLILAERFGKAIRSPARDTILSLASKKLGYGKGFAIHEALDQIGSVAGPFFISFILANFGYKPSFFVLFIPAILSFLLLISAERVYKKIYKDEDLKEEKESNHISEIKKSKEWKKIPVILFFIFSTMTIFSALNFQLISYHMKVSGVKDHIIPQLFALAMIVDAISAIPIGLIFDKLKDRWKLLVLCAMPISATISNILIFSKSFYIGCLIWGFYIGMTESVMRSAVAQITPEQKRGIMFGIFHTLYGISFLVGGSVFGKIYPDIGKILTLVFVSQTLSLFFLFLTMLSLNTRSFQD